MDGETEKKLIVISDTRGNVIATAFSQNQPVAEDAPHARMLPANKNHRVFEVNVPANFQELSPDRLHESVKERLRSTAGRGGPNAKARRRRPE